VKWNRSNAKAEPDKSSPLPNEPQISEAGNADIYPRALCMRSINVIARRSTYSLHAVIACSQKKSANDIDNKMDPNAKFLDVAAITNANGCDI
jgi:hypothetical protein